MYINNINISINTPNDAIIILTIGINIDMNIIFLTLSDLIKSLYSTLYDMYPIIDIITYIIGIIIIIISSFIIHY